MIRAKVAHWGRSEWLTLMKGLFASQSRRITWKGNLTALLSNEYASSCLLMNSARSAIAIGLDFAKLHAPRASEVIVPEFICASVPDTIKQAGCTPIYVPVDTSLNIDATQMSSFINDKTRAVIVPHMYSKPANIQAIVQICRENEIFVIDDAAQVAGIRVDNKPLGTFGDMGVLSFAQAKTIVTGVQGSGGALLTNNETLKQYLHDNITPLCSASSRWTNLLHFLMSYYWQGPFKALDYYRQRAVQKLQGTTESRFYQLTDIWEVEAGIATSQFKSLKSRQQHTIQTLERYRVAFAGLNSINCPQLTEDVRYLSRCILQSKTVAPQQAITYLAQQGIQGKRVYGKGSEPYNGAPASGLFEIPLQNLNVQDQRKVIDALVKLDKASDNRS